MAEDLQANLENYRLQLQQVEAAILAEPNNEDLLKLKTDLEEVIALTRDLVGGPEEDEEGAAAPSASSSAGGADPLPLRKWQVGDRCLALWHKDGQFYEAMVDGIRENVAFITFVGSKITATNKFHELRIAETKSQYKLLEDKKAKRKQFEMDRERRQKRREKKAERLKNLEETKEQDKRKWLQFTAKAQNKSLKGVKKEGNSIFASTEHPEGKIGVGTCGTSGKPVTKYHLGEVYRKGQEQGQKRW